MVLFAEINQALSPYSMLQHIGRVATPNLVPRNCLRYLQTILIMGEGDWSQNLCDVSLMGPYYYRWLCGQQKYKAYKIQF